MASEKDRAYGALIGLAIGDALAVPLDGLQRDSIPRIVDMLGGGRFNLEPGDWTSPTSMALALGSALVDNKRVDGQAIIGRFDDWYHRGAYSARSVCFDIPESVAAAIDNYRHTRRITLGGPQAMDAGSLTRLAPISIAEGRDLASCALAARLQGDLTHSGEIPATIVSVAAQAMALAIFGLATKERMLWAFEMIGRNIGKWREVDRGKVHSSGNVVDTLKASLWAIDATNTFEEALILAVNLAGHASEIGAVTGQLAGAVYGAKSIPPRWLDQLAWRDYIYGTAIELYESRQ
jgi:ADP-ribosyl-[dinitrogen reductase] hydrolase